MWAGSTTELRAAPLWLFTPLKGSSVYAPATYSLLDKQHPLIFLPFLLSPPFSTLLTRSFVLFFFSRQFNLLTRVDRSKIIHPLHLLSQIAALLPALGTKMMTTSPRKRFDCQGGNIVRYYFRTEATGDCDKITMEEEKQQQQQLVAPPPPPPPRAPAAAAAAAASLPATVCLLDGHGTINSQEMITTLTGSLKNRVARLVDEIEKDRCELREYVSSHFNIFFFMSPLPPPPPLLTIWTQVSINQHVS